MSTRLHVEDYKVPRWETELDKPEKTVAIYLSETAVKNLRYNLGHLTAPHHDTGVSDDLSLSEAITKLGSEWIRLSNHELACKRKHRGKGITKVIEAYWMRKHRKCTPERCARSDSDRCPVWEW